MGSHSLRTRILVSTLLFAIVLVGVVSAAIYFVIDNAILDVAQVTAVSIANSASESLQTAMNSSRLAESSSGLTGDEAEEAARREFMKQVPASLRRGVSGEGEFALYDEDLEPVWFSDPVALNDHEDHRRTAAESHFAVDSNKLTLHPFTGMFGHVKPEVYYLHVPIDFPGGGDECGVLDVAYVPVREAAIVDKVRPIMAILTFVTAALAMIMIQLSTVWILRLIERVREAADLIESGDLNTRLPEGQKNEIGDLARSVNRLIDRLRKRADAQTQFVADASHELATPVAGIRGYVNILRAWGSEDPSVRSEAIEAIDRESERMARLCGDLLSLIRQERFTTPQIDQVDVNTIARDVLVNAANRYLEKGIEFVGPEEGELIIESDRDRLAQLFAIIVDNAAKYTNKGGKVSITTTQRSSEVEIAISDTGVGIQQDQLAHIFDRFYKTDRSRSQKSGGFGLGLSIAKQIVDSSGGRIMVESQVDLGTTFWIMLPESVRDAKTG